MENYEAALKTVGKTMQGKKPLPKEKNDGSKRKHGESGGSDDEGSLAGEVGGKNAKNRFHSYEIDDGDRSDIELVSEDSRKGRDNTHIHKKQKGGDQSYTGKSAVVAEVTIKDTPKKNDSIGRDTAAASISAKETSKKNSSSSSSSRTGKAGAEGSEVISGGKDDAVAAGLSQWNSMNQTKEGLQTDVFKGSADQNDEYAGQKRKSKRVVAGTSGEACPGEENNANKLQEKPAKGYERLPDGPAKGREKKHASMTRDAPESGEEEEVVTSDDDMEANITNALKQAEDDSGCQVGGGEGNGHKGSTGDIPRDSDDDDDDNDDEVSSTGCHSDSDEDEECGKFVDPDLF